MSNLLVLDATNLAHRLLHGVSDRDPVEVFGFTIERYRKAYDPSYAVACFDPIHDSSSWRRELWPEYKAASAVRTEAVGRLLCAAQAECRAAGLAVAEVPGLEADDLIGAYTEAAVAEGWPVTILSSDKDMGQLVRVDPPVRLVREVPRPQVWDPSTVRERFGVEPERLPDVLALAGDRSDGIPGVPGIGVKTAAKLLAEQGPTLERLLDRKALIRSRRMLDLLTAHEAEIEIYLQLARLRTGDPLPVPLDGCRWRRPGGV